MGNNAGAAAPIQGFSFGRTDVLKEWLSNQPDGGSLTEDSKIFGNDADIWLWFTLSYPLTLAFWLQGHLDRVLTKTQRETIVIAIIGANDWDVGPGVCAEYYRFVPRLLGLERDIELTFVGRQFPRSHQRERTLAESKDSYPRKVTVIRDDWQNHEARLIDDGLDAAFLFHPGLHQHDFLPTGSIKPLVVHGIPVGMASYTVEDGENDDTRLREYGLRLQPYRDNPFLMQGVCSPKALGALWDIELYSKANHARREDFWRTLGISARLLAGID